MLNLVFPNMFLIHSAVSFPCIYLFPSSPFFFFFMREFAEFYERDYAVIFPPSRLDFYSLKEKLHNLPSTPKLIFIQPSLNAILHQILQAVYRIKNYRQPRKTTYLLYSFLISASSSFHQSRRGKGGGGGEGEGGRSVFVFLH